MTVDPHGMGARRIHELIMAAKAGQADAWRQLDQRYRESLRLFLRGRIPAKARRQFETDDALQSGLLLAFRELDQYQYRGAGSFEAWLRKIIHNRLTSRVRRIEARARELSASEAAELACDPAETRWLEASPAEIADQAERQVQLVQSIAELDEELREVLSLHFFDRCSISSIARDLDLSPRTIGRRLARALEELSRRMC